MRRSRYTWKVIDEFLAITDIGGDTISVTNDAEQVIRDLAAFDLDLAKLTVVYRDSDQRWDGIVVRDGAFAGFIELAARSFPEAVLQASALVACDLWRTE